MSEIASVTQRGTTEPFYFQVGRGQISWHRNVTMFGYNADLDIEEEVIWPDGSVVGWQETATTLTVSSSDANDSAAGTGAQTISISGLDGDHNEISEIVALNGLTAVTTAKTYTHINGMTVITVGSGGANAGKIYVGKGTVTDGIPETIYNIIEIGFNNSTSGIYTVPAGYTAYMVLGGITAGQAVGTTAVVGKLAIQDTNGIIRSIAVTVLNNGVSRYDFNVPIAIPEKNTIQTRAFGTANNNIVSSFFQLILVKDSST